MLASWSRHSSTYHGTSYLLVRLTRAGIGDVRPQENGRRRTSPWLASPSLVDQPSGISQHLSTNVHITPAHTPDRPPDRCLLTHPLIVAVVPASVSHAMVATAAAMDFSGLRERWALLTCRCCSRPTCCIQIAPKGCSTFTGDSVWSKLSAFTITPPNLN